MTRATRVVCEGYDQSPWSDAIEGTKARLQAFGLGIGQAFPGEPGGPQRALKTTDPRGFETRIFALDVPGTYRTIVYFPGRSSPPEPPTLWRGLQVERCDYFDAFTGTAEALEAAGVVRRNQLPGQPGMRKHYVTIFADGSMPSGSVNAAHRAAREPGAKRVSRASKGNYRVDVYVSKVEQERRREASARDRDREYARVCSLSIPEPLTPMSSDAVGRYAHAIHAAREDAVFRTWLRRTLNGTIDSGS